MSFQVRVRVNKNTIKVLSVASTSEEFEQFTIGDLKRKALSFFPSVNDPDRLRVIFGQNELEDSQTFEECGIKHLSLLIIVLRMRGVGGGPPQSRGNESFGKVTETVELLDRLRISRSFVQSGAEKEKIQERDSVSQYKGATKPRSDADPRFDPQEGMRRTNSKEHLPPNI